MPSAIVVDPNRYSSLLLRRSLERCGYRVELVDSAATALVALRAQAFDIMFVDADQLDAEVQAVAPPRTIVTSAKLRSRIEPILARAGIRELLRKPIRNDDLMNVLAPAVHACAAR